jgi:hypothetical protein
MPKHRSHKSSKCHPRSLSKLPLVLCLFLFALISAGVFGWGYASWTPGNARATYSATAYVVEKTEEPVSEGSRIPLAIHHDDPQHAEETANALAECYIEDRRLEWKQHAEHICQKARAEVEKARREHQQAVAAIEAFRHEMSDAATKTRATVESRKNLPPPMIDNPEWLDLNGQLSELKRRRDNLLVDRTPLHPAVQELDLQMKDLQAQMAAVPRQLAGKPQPQKPTEVVDSKAKENQAKLAELKSAVETALHGVQQAESAEKLSAELEKAGPQFKLIEAEVVENPASPVFDPWRLAGISLLAGLCAALGAVVISAGSSIDPITGSADQVKADARLTVVGIIPAEDPIADALNISRRQSRVRRAMIAAGLFLIVAGPLAVVWAS